MMSLVELIVKMSFTALVIPTMSFDAAREPIEGEFTW
jgi:hypothetical protein